LNKLILELIFPGFEQANFRTNISRFWTSFYLWHIPQLNRSFWPTLGV